MLKLRYGLVRFSDYVWVKFFFLKHLLQLPGQVELIRLANYVNDFYLNQHVFDRRDLPDYLLDCDFESGLRNLFLDFRQCVHALKLGRRWIQKNVLQVKDVHLPISADSESAGGLTQCVFAEHRVK